jgi:hypothetical protein
MVTNWKNFIATIESGDKVTVTGVESTTIVSLQTDLYQ